MLEPEVSGAGIGWHNGDLTFIVKTDSLEKAAALRSRLPDKIEGFPLVFDMGRLPETTGAMIRATRPEQHDRGLTATLARFVRRFWPQRDWLAFAVQH
jgi:hypothetical protein